MDTSRSGVRGGGSHFPSRRWLVIGGVTAVVLLYILVSTSHSRPGATSTGAWVLPADPNTWKGSLTLWAGYQLDESLAQACVNEVFNGKSVNDMGGGVGRYKHFFLSTGKVASVETYDGAPNIAELSKGYAKYADLARPQQLPVADWVFSLEVGEHIPKQYEANFLDNLHRHNREGIVMSWAVPGQDGYGHVNEQPNSYIISKVEPLGYTHDAETSKRLTDSATLPWFKRSGIMVFRKK